MCEGLYTGRFTLALFVCEEKFPTLIEKPVAAATEILSISGSGKYEIMNKISDILFRCKQYKAALQLYHYMKDEGISDMGYDKAWCHYRLGEYKSALDLIHADRKNSERYQSILRCVYMEMGRYDDAETQFVLALQTKYGNLIEHSNNTDYYGRPLKSTTSTIAQKDTANILAQSPEDHLHAIRDTSPDIIACLVCLADVYSKSGKYPQAAAYYKKALQCLYEYHKSNTANRQP